MTPESIMSLGQNSIYVTLLVVAPILGIALVVGLVVSILQTVTQIQEQTLSFAPKIIAVFAGLLIFGPWMLKQLMEFTQNILANLPSFIG